MHSAARIGVTGILLACTLVLVPQLAFAANITISATDNAFSGKTLDINPGDTVIWKNNGSISHSVVADNASFDSGALVPGATYSQTFNQAGNYPYYDRTYGSLGGFGMAGLIRVGNPATIQTQTVVQTPSPTPVTQVVAQPVTTVTLPTTTSNATAQSLLAQVAQLQQFIAAIKNGNGGASSPSVSGGGTLVPTGGGVSSGACPQISRALRSGMSGNDVSQLQQYLARDPSVYPEAQVSGYFGALTQAAVQRWQVKYGIVSSGTPDTTGFGSVGPRTASAIMGQCASSGTSVGVVTPDNAPTVGGLIQVTPTTGDAPLTVSVVATVNTTNSCQGALYVLNWGDGTEPQAIGVSGNLCKQLQQTYTHTYTYGGQYIVKLSSQGHESVATLFINGPARPAGVTGSQPGIVVSSPSGGQNYSTGSSLSITWKSNATVPSSASTVFDLYTGAGQKVAANDVIAISQYSGGTLPWTIPVATTAQACPAVYPSGLCGVAIPTGSYKIRATVYQSSSGNTFGPVIVSGESGIFTIIATVATSSLQSETFTASPTSGTSPLTVTFSGVLTSADKNWCSSGCFDLIRYGDGTGDFIALPTAANSTLPYSLTHTYQSGGSYTATLYQGEVTTSPTVGAPLTITVNGGSFTYSPLSVTSVGGNAFSAVATFNLPNSCAGYQISWGDASATDVQTNDGCTTSPVTLNLTHTYATVGNFTITLTRNNGAKIDTVGYGIGAI